MNTHQIFAPYSYQNLSVKNKIVRSGTNDYSGSTLGAVTEIQLDLYEKLAKGNVGLIVTGNFYVTNDGRLDMTQNSITEERDFEGNKKLVEIVHKWDSKIVFQISHAGRKSKLSEEIRLKYSSAENISENAIKSIMIEFFKSVKRAVNCGADGVQLHFGHGYLLSEILEERSDGLELISNLLKMIKNEMPSYPILVKFNSDISKEQFIAFIQLCQKYDIWAIELSGSDLINKQKEDRNYYENKISIVKENCTVPVILTGGIRSIEDGQNALCKGADLLGLSRPLISEPNLLQDWRVKESRCISCNQCFTLYKTMKKRCIFHQ